MQDLDIWVHDSTFKRFDVIDEYESFIWAERFFAHGDFTIVIPPTAKAKKLLVFGNYVSHPDTDFVMKIENILEETNDGKTLLTVTGRTLTNILEDRQVNPNWVGVGVVGAVVANLVQIICVDGPGISSYDIIPGFAVQNTSWSAGYIQTKPEQSESLYAVIQKICASDGTGFRVKLEYHPSGSRLIFEVYNGSHAPILTFSVDNDNLINPSFLVSTQNYANIAYVWHEQGTKIVARPGTALTVSGLARRVVGVDATDVKAADHVVDQYNAILTQRAMEAFVSEKGDQIRLYDGEVPAGVDAVYRKDYNLGDLAVYVGSSSDQRRTVRITEHILSCDNQGMKAYPTFSVVD
jgi:hypothetical protein